FLDDPMPARVESCEGMAAGLGLRCDPPGGEGVVHPADAQHTPGHTVPSEQTEAIRREQPAAVRQPAAVPVTVDVAAHPRREPLAIVPDRLWIKRPENGPAPIPQRDPG